MFPIYDVIVVGGGHAGSEAAAAAANLGSKVLLITQNLDRICQLSCNPAMGGVAKGQIVREIDAMGGYSGIVADHSAIQFRMLNRSKGPAMWSPRTQNDGVVFSLKWRAMLEATPNVDFWQDEVKKLVIENNAVQGVVTAQGITIGAKSVVLTNGTFLNGRIHIGEISFSGGRMGEKNATGLSEYLKEYGFEVKTLKTGTPMRIDGRTIDFSVLSEQKGDENPKRFSFLDTPVLKDQKSCYLAYTNEEVHDILRTGFDRSPLFQGRIKGVGPRYCPSIEDKIERFSEKDHHQLFVEPEGRYSQIYYLNGFSSSLPQEIQFAALKKISGFEHAKPIKSGYAIEYDYFPPTQLKISLETKNIERLFFAGQINGTTGYEEAGGQGLIAGINAHLTAKEGKEPLILNRADAYIGVLIDDLVTKGVDEPYRMFTSRAEHRILLRQDNADERLTPISHGLGLASDERMRKMELKKKYADNLSSFIEQRNVEPEEVSEYLESINTPTLSQRTKLKQLLLRPQVTLRAMTSVLPFLQDSVEQIEPSLREEVSEKVEIQIKYANYIEKEQETAERLLKFEKIPLKPDFDYHALKSLSWEAREKLSKLKPANLGQASRISGVSPADISVLLIYLRK